MTMLYEGKISQIDHYYDRTFVCRPLRLSARLSSWCPCHIQFTKSIFARANEWKIVEDEWQRPLLFEIAEQIGAYIDLIDREKKKWLFQFGRFDPN